ncbi:MAG: aldolase/citrate lyase family protein [Gammaproteobacteria bacterium]|nr:aldolase/citrate lyase family protein [Gammaproteobacteria bacterium]MCY4209659.1 aldolase/citrate lyase family protein [Gammaproteobacteria bacterium]MCY4282685.1 aldolase/citrate lyase family protein [Gammaproteobacteria bacterium]MCY4339041.1 aldolase/citrate lyase family protein [Gammaproteobacteria bacterium]
MELPVNRLKQALAAGRTQYGLWLGLPDTTCAEICAGAGFDWLVVDTEHGPFDLPTTLRHLQTLAAYDVQAVVRPVSDDRNLLKQLLDAGAQSLVVPMIEAAEQAAQLVRAVRYPPAGVRGLGTALARAARWTRIPDYLHRANDQICLLAQVETERAVAALPGILAVEGIDGIFVGPSDLSASMGHIGNARHPDVVKVIREVLRQARAAGKAAGILALDPDHAQEYRAHGANMIGIGTDTLLLAHSAQRLAQSVSDEKNQG